jgi:hypothetical protein
MGRARESMQEQGGVIYCGSCGALNPRTNHYCSACGHQLVDAYHPSEGLRVYLTPDPGAALVEIVDPGSDITVVETTEDLPADFAKVLLEDGRLGYVRLREVESVAADGVASGRREATGCISSTAVLAILALLLISATFVFVTAVRGGNGSNNFIAVLACITIVPFLLLVVGLYLYMRKREDELLDDADDDAPDEPRTPEARRPLTSDSD